jgi:hypothetical protein
MLPFWVSSLVLPANVKLDWKVIARYKHSSLFGLIISNEGKKLITLTPGVFISYKFFQASLTLVTYQVPLYG